MRSKPQDMVFAFDVVTPKPPCLSRCYGPCLKEVFFNKLTSPKLTSWGHVPIIGLVMHQLTIPEKL